MVNRITDILDLHADLCALLEQSIRQAAAANPDLQTNPVRTVDDWRVYVERFVKQMPWENLNLGEDASFFRRIDQNIGYFYFLLDQPLDALKGKGYIYPSLQYEPRMAAWLKEYNKAWGAYLSSVDSWRDEYYRMALADNRFELSTERYESLDNWHSWNDFFARRLRNPLTAHRSPLTFVSPCDGEIATAPVKTASITNWIDLLGDSAYREVFAEGETTHIVLDVYDYHRFHAPCDSKVLECRVIQGIHAGGGVIIWDKSQHRYRYEQLGVTDFQMHETRGVLVLDTRDFGKMAMVAVGVQQVSSVVWHEQVKPGTELHQGDELGRFLFGGSDIVLLFEQGKAPALTDKKTIKVGEPI